jgi:hypothetical protein
MTMPVRAARSGSVRRTVKRRPIDAVEADRAAALGNESEVDDWQELDDASERLDEGQMEILLTGRAATHGIEGEDNWLIETEETQWGER